VALIKKIHYLETLNFNNNSSLSNVPILDTEEHLSERVCGYTLFSKYYRGQLIAKVVKIDDVVQKFIDSKTITEAERKSLRNYKVADQKFRHLLAIITVHCNRDDLQPFKTFIDILGDTGNVDVAKQLLLICNERVRSSHLICKFRVRIDLIYIYILSFSEQNYMAKR
jgi:hypothetical protein